MVIILKWRLLSGDLALSREETWRISSAVNGSKGCFEAEVGIVKVCRSISGSRASCERDVLVSVKARS